MYALQMHKDVAEVLTVAFDGDEADKSSLMKVLSHYPAAFSFLVAQHRIIKSKYMQEKRDFDKESEIAYASASKGCPAKSTVTSIKSKMNELYGDALFDMQTRVDELEQKTKLAHDMMNVFDKSINALQSLGKLLSNEIDVNRRQT